MKTLIHTLNSQFYMYTVLLTCSLGCSNIASHLHSRWFSAGSVNVVLLNWIVKAIIITLGIFYISWSSMFSGPIWMQFLSVIPAIFFGIFCVKLEYFIQRFNLRKGKVIKTDAPQRYVYLQPISNQTQGIAPAVISNKHNLKNIHEHYARLDSKINNYMLRDIVLVAICEEVIFRGYLYQLSCMFDSQVAVAIALGVTVLLFGISHITLGRGQFLSKTILGMVCLFAVILAHSLLPAVVIHVVFNTYAYQEMVKIHGK